MENDKTTIQLKRNQLLLNIIRFGAFPLGWVMYFLTINSFGELVASILCGLAAMSFWLIISKGKERLIYEALSEKVHEAIKEVEPLDSQIEMKAFTGGMIIRIFLLKPGDKLVTYNQAIYRKLANWDIAKKSWFVQISNIESYADVDRTRAILDEELLEEIKKAKEQQRKDK